MKLTVKKMSELFQKGGIGGFAINLYPPSLAHLFVVKKMFASLHFLSLQINVSALALFYRCLHVLAFATGKYPSLRSDLSTPASRKREVSRVLRSYEYLPVMLRSTGACIFLYKRGN